MKGIAMLALLVMAACAPDGPQRVVEERASSTPAPRGDALLRTAMLDDQNAARTRAGVPPLVWDATLAEHARAYALELARTGRFEHADQPQGPGREGENLWTGTGGAYGYDEMVGHWVDEKRFFTNGVTPDFSTTGDYRDAVHYAQIVWRNTRRVGCALASNARDDVLVCRYDPPGNVVGERAY
ncbi:MAG TPA: CAP domain-containing protein [Sphingomonas sp.]|nr:CAP domain-containing protein [Sphingomonas sp.]